MCTCIYACMPTYVCPPLSHMLKITFEWLAPISSSLSSSNVLAVFAGLLLAFDRSNPFRAFKCPSPTRYLSWILIKLVRFGSCVYFRHGSLYFFRFEVPVLRTSFEQRHVPTPACTGVISRKSKEYVHVNCKHIRVLSTRLRASLQAKTFTNCNH